MKKNLFVYKLVLGDTVYGDRLGFASAVLEVEETAKSYKVDSKALFGSRKLLRKSELGIVDPSRYNTYIVILPEDNPILAKELLRAHFKERLDFSMKVYEGHLTEFNTAVSLMDSY